MRSDVVSGEWSEVLDLGGGIEAEVLGRLVRTLAPLDVIGDVSGKDGAFEVEGRVKYAK